MRDELATVLRLVADGRLTPEEAAPLIDALSRAPAGSTPSGLHPEARPERDVRPATASPSAAGRGARQVRIRVVERGRQVVNLRIPLAFADKALSVVPGISSQQSDQIRAAIAGGAIGPILEVEDEDGDGVVISME